MKKQLLFTLAFVAILLHFNNSYSQSFPNPGFENWTVDTTFGFLQPDGWLTTNYPPTACVVQTNGHTGAHAVRLNTILDASSTITGGEIDCYAPTSVRPILISGYWKYLNAGTLDGIFINMYVKNQGTVIGTFTAHTPGNSLPNWTAFSDSVYYGPTGVPDNFSIVIYYLPTSTTSLNGYGAIDDLTMTYLAGINDTVVAKFPSANLLQGATSNTHRLLIDLLSGTTMTAQIFDLQGKLLNTQSTNLNGGHHEFPVDFSDYRPGQYLYIVTLGSKVQHFKVNKL